MLFADIKLPMPQGTKYEYKIVHGKDKYIYYRVKTYRAENGKIRHERIAIGKALVDELTQVEYLVPNENYYKHLNLELPKHSKMKKCGRVAKADIKDKPTQIKYQSKLSFALTVATYAIANETKLLQFLTESFGEEISNKIMTVATFFLIGSPGGLSNIDYFTEKTMSFLDVNLNSQRLSELYTDIDEYNQNEFFKKWIAHCTEKDYICYDVTSISTYSSTLALSTWGYNRDKEYLDQINLSVFCAVNSKLPLYFTPYNGNINDYTNLHYTIENAKDVGIKDDFTIVFDTRFSLEKALNSEGIRDKKFIVGAPLNNFAQVKELVFKWRIYAQEQNANLIPLDTEIVRSKEVEYSVDKLKTRLVMYQQPTIALEAEKAILQDVRSNQAILDNKVTITKENAKKYGSLFDFQIEEDGKFTYSINNEEYDKILRTCGCFALFCTNDKLTAENILNIYRNKDCVEKAFAVIKNDILDERLRVKTNEALKGKMFIAFVSLILHVALKEKLQSYCRENKMTFTSVINKLYDLECSKHGDLWISTKDITKQQREILKELDLNINYLK